MAPGHDGNVWFIGDPSKMPMTFGRINPQTWQVDVATLPTNPRAITPNPDGNMYVAADGCNLYQVHPDMTFTTFQYSCSNSNIGKNIVTGYDGRIWIVDGSNVITRVSTAGQASTLQMPDLMFSIMRGNSTGRAMFAQGFNEQDGSYTYYRIAPDDSVTSAQVYMGLTTVGHDGMIWGFAAATSRNTPQFMVRMADDLTFTQFPVSNKVTAVKVLPHANFMLMPAPVATKIFRFNTTKDVLAPGWPDAGEIEDAIIGPNRTLWLTNDGLDVYVGTIN
ncbi:MAG TPA: hypothetical protein VFO25_08380 [Candidatus Eremiobacteraceae bacterium]|nr:hypothetical protein [Candidatus Eremiobacteraceae bacterium]